MKHPFNDVELTELFELARLAMTDATTFDRFGEQLDLNDDYLVGLREKVQKFMEGDSHG